MADQTPTNDTNWLTGAAASPYQPIIAGLFRGAVGILSGIGFTWAATVTGDQITMGATAALALGMLVWSGWQKIAAIRSARKSEVAAALASAEATMAAGKATPVTVTVTPAGQDNITTMVSRTEAAAAPRVPSGIAPQSAPL